MILLKLLTPTDFTNLDDKNIYIMSEIKLIVSVTKITVAISIVGAYLQAGSMPLKFESIKTNRVLILFINQFALSFLSAISGGLLLAVSLILILPYAVTRYPSG